MFVGGHVKMPILVISSISFSSKELISTLTDDNKQYYVLVAGVGMKSGLDNSDF